MPEVRDAMTNGHCFLQLEVWGHFEPPAVPRGPPEGLEILQLTLAKNAKNTPSWSIYPKLQFHEFC